jgi:menaquinone-dependent protoporphyrinogen IX oxidase
MRGRSADAGTGGAATKYGATAEIGKAIAEVLGEGGLEPTVLPPEQVEGVDGYDFPERAIVAALRVPEGDFRDWTEIRHWAAGIAEALRPRPRQPGGEAAPG